MKKQNDFTPGYWFLHLAKPDPFACLAEVFDSFTLPELLHLYTEQQVEGYLWNMFECVLLDGDSQKQ